MMYPSKARKIYERKTVRLACATECGAARRRIGCGLEVGRHCAYYVQKGDGRQGT